MATKIRLRRIGAKHDPNYQIVVLDSRIKRDGKYIEKVGYYKPRLADGNPDRFVFKADRILHWLSLGAILTEVVAIRLYNAGMVEAKKHLPASYPADPLVRAKMKEDHKNKKIAEKLAKEDAAA